MQPNAFSLAKNPGNASQQEIVAAMAELDREIVRLEAEAERQNTAAAETFLDELASGGADSKKLRAARETAAEGAIKRSGSSTPPLPPPLPASARNGSRRSQRQRGKQRPTRRPHTLASASTSPHCSRKSATT